MTQEQERKSDIARRLGVSEWVLEQYLAAKWAESDNDPLPPARMATGGKRQRSPKRRPPWEPVREEEI